jgi:hypothetical protein
MLDLPDPKYFSFGSTRTKAENALDQANARVRELQRQNAPANQINKAIQQANKARRNVCRLRGQ